MACIYISHYPKVKGLIHPNITNNTDYCKKGNHFILPRVDYKREEHCVLPTNKPYWRRTKEKYKLKRAYKTRH